MSKVCVVYNAEREPWIVPYDAFLNDGRPGIIDEDDLPIWAMKALDENERKTIPSSGYCSLFKCDMFRCRFIHEVVEPETKRTEKLSDEDRQERSYNVMIRAMDETLALARANQMDMETRLNDTRDPTASEKTASMVSQHAWSVTEDFFVRKVGDSIMVAAIETQVSLTNDRSTLAGCGIEFKKEPGKPAYVVSLEPRLKDAGLAEKLQDGWIVAIDGRETISMTEGQVRNALRGPVGIDAVLVTQAKGSKEKKEVRITRVLNQGFLSPYNNK